MLGGLISGLFVAWILVSFDVHAMVFKVLQPFASVPLETAHFYVALGLIGLIGGAFRK